MRICHIDKENAVATLQLLLEAYGATVQHPMVIFWLAQCQEFGAYSIQFQGPYELVGHGMQPGLGWMLVEHK